MAVAAPPRRQSHIAPGMVGQPSRCEAQPVTNEGQRDHLRIGILTPLAAGGYFGGVIGGIVASAEARGARLIVIQTLDLGGGAAPRPRGGAARCWGGLGGAPPPPGGPGGPGFFPPTPGAGGGGGAGGPE